MSKEKSSAGLWVAVAGAALLAVPIIYGLLLGPVAYQCAAKKISIATFSSVAYPASACINFTDGEPYWFWAPTERYWDWWVQRGLANRTSL